jgi:hypothetical protein
VLHSTSEIFGQLDILTRREKTGSDAKEHLAQLLSNCDEGDQEVIKKIIAKDPDCGCSIGSANRTWPGLIYVWPCHKCERYNEKNMSNITWPAIIQDKSDGMRINVIVKNGTVTTKTRNGNPVELHGKLDEHFLRLAALMDVDEVVFDGEGLVKDENGNIMPRKKGNGILNKGVRQTISVEEADRVMMNLWNKVPLSVFVPKGKDGVPYIIALNTLAKGVDDLNESVEDSKIKLVAGEIVSDLEEAEAFYQARLAEGKEGAVIKNFNSVWEDRRSKFQVKLKIEDPADLLIKDVYPHRKDPNLIGGFVLVDSTGVLETRCGSGLRAVDREKDPSEYIGRIVSIKYNEVIDSDSKPGKMALFLPIICHDSDDDCIRLDKSEPDTLVLKGKKWTLK